MDFSLSSIIAGLIFGVSGLWIFREGKRNTNFFLIVIGILLMTFQLFVSGAKLTWLIGLGLFGAARYFWHRG